MGWDIRGEGSLREQIQTPLLGDCGSTHTQPPRDPSQGRPQGKISLGVVVDAQGCLFDRSCHSHVCSGLKVEMKFEEVKMGV